MKGNPRTQNYTILIRNHKSYWPCLYFSCIPYDPMTDIIYIVRFLYISQWALFDNDINALCIFIKGKPGQFCGLYQVLFTEVHNPGVDTYIHISTIMANIFEVNKVLCSIHSKRSTRVVLKYSPYSRYYTLSIQFGCY